MLVPMCAATGRESGELDADWSHSSWLTFVSCAVLQGDPSLVSKQRVLDLLEGDSHISIHTTRVSTFITSHAASTSHRVILT
jgi:hypothetical protein